MDTKVITVNASLEQLGPPTVKQIDFDSHPKEKTDTYAPMGGGDDGDSATKTTTYFSGFLIDLLDEIRKKYQSTGKTFPPYRIVMSRLFGPPGSGGGFGSKEMPKASAGGGKDEKSEEGDEKEKSKELKGMVKEVHCQKNKVALMPITPTPERRLKVDFSEPFFDTVSLSILMKKPILQ